VKGALASDARYRVGKLDGGQAAAILKSAHFDVRYRVGKLDGGQGGVILEKAVAKSGYGVVCAALGYCVSGIVTAPPAPV
jgi:hypothetical protein